MKVVQFILLFFYSCTGVLAQSGFPQYYRYIDLAHQADTLYQAGQYGRAASTYILASQVEVERGIEVAKADMVYNAACSYALAGQKKEAFECLNVLGQEYGYTEAERMQTDADFVSLNRDPQWNKVLAQISSNQERARKMEVRYAERTRVPDINDDVVFYPLDNFAKQYLQVDTMPFLSVNHEIFRIYFSGDSYAANHLEEIKRELSAALQRALSILHIEHYNRGINILLYNSVEEMKQMTGIRAQGGVAYPAHDIAFFPFHSERRPQFKHELFHVIANQQWGYTYSRLLNEGSAVYADDHCYVDNPIYSINALLLQDHLTFPMQDLVRNFDALAVQSDVIAYLQAAGVFKYLYEKYGVEKMKLLWNAGFDQFESIYGLSIEQFEKEWVTFIGSVPPPPVFDLEKFLKEGCG